jgi:hypothetical protein
MGRYDALTQLDKKAENTPPLSEPSISTKPPVTQEQKEVAGKPANLQTGKETILPTSMQTSKHANIQAGKSANLQAGKQVNLQTGKQVMIEKYSSYLTHEYKREMKRIAWESDRNEYEVLIEAVEQFLANQKKTK